MYIYGGYSIYCQNACNDTWRYEISYGPEWMYPNQNGSVWKKGNTWELINNGSKVCPGNRFKHSMVYDEVNRYIYLFGGIVIVDGINTFSNDLWRLEVDNGNWVKINTQGIVNITRTIMLWDATNQTVLINPSQQKVIEIII